MKCVDVALLMLCLISIPTKATKIEPSPQIPLPAIQGNALAGKIKSEENRCQECHGADGNGQGLSAGSAGKFAKLAGQYPDYITKQINEFRTGARKNDLMLIMARSIDDTDAADIAAYFSQQKKMQGDGTGSNEVAKNLFVNGDSQRNIPACMSCHGINGKGFDLARQTIPAIGGQEWRYLEKQLQDWRNGERHNSPDGIMNKITQSLTDTEVQALADYISGL